jgi:hypothetical protein
LGKGHPELMAKPNSQLRKGLSLVMNSSTIVITGTTRDYDKFPFLKKMGISEF